MLQVDSYYFCLILFFKKQKHTPLLCVSGTKRNSGVDLDFHTRDQL